MRRDIEYASAYRDNRQPLYAVIREPALILVPLVVVFVGLQFIVPEVVDNLALGVLQRRFIAGHHNTIDIRDKMARLGQVVPRFVRSRRVRVDGQLECHGLLDVSLCSLVVEQGETGESRGASARCV